MQPARLQRFCPPHTEHEYKSVKSGELNKQYLYLTRSRRMPEERDTQEYV